MLDLVFQNSISDPRYAKGFGEASKSPKKDFFENIIKAGIRELNMADKNIEISVNLVGDRKIKELNNKYRRKNKVTDALSFPMSSGALQKLLTTNYLLHTTDLGDIFICLPFAKKQAKSENVSIDKKLAQLTVHGFLHLAGYDHERSSGEAKKMLDLENRILKRLSIF